MSGLRFAMVTTFYPPNHFGGDAIFIRRLAQALARRGHEVDVIHDVDAFELLHRGPTPAPIDDGPRIRTHPLRSRVGSLSCLLTQQLGGPSSTASASEASSTAASSTSCTSTTSRSSEVPRSWATAAVSSC